VHGFQASNPHTRALLLAALATLGLFTAHHVYGALLYQTPWRHHAGVVALGVAAALLAMAALYRRRTATPAGRLAGGLLAVLALAFPVLLVGLYEGLYNHVLKDVLFLAGAPRELMLLLFPPPTYTLPDDVLFEASGALQALAALLTARALLRFVRALRSRPTPQGRATPLPASRGA
jgi:hypothetical protein